MVDKEIVPKIWNNFEELEIGMIVEGKVTNIKKYEKDYVIINSLDLYNKRKILWA